MPFPISRNSTFQVAGAGDPRALVEPTLAAIEAWLAARGAGRIQRADDGLTFRAGFMPLLTDWRKSTSRRLAVKWNPLMTVGSGRVQVSGGERGIEVSYSLRFTELIVFCLVLFLVFLGASHATNPAPDSTLLDQWIAGIWLVMIPLGYLVASIGIGVALENVAREAVAGSAAT